MSERPFWFEDYPEDQKYWFLAPLGTSPRLKDESEASVFRSSEDALAKIRKELELMEASGYGEKALEEAEWPGVYSAVFADRGGREHLAPILYTRKELAEEELDRVQAREPEDYRQDVKQYGQAFADKAWTNRLPPRVLWVDRGTLIDKLEASHFLYVMVDGELKQRRRIMRAPGRMAKCSEPELVGPRLGCVVATVLPLGASVRYHREVVQSRPPFEFLAVPTHHLWPKRSVLSPVPDLLAQLLVSRNATIDV
jgi:hypothetical protein